MPDHIKPLPDPEPQKPRRRWPLYLLAVLSFWRFSQPSC